MAMINLKNVDSTMELTNNTFTSKDMSLETIFTIKEFLDSIMRACRLDDISYFPLVVSHGSRNSYYHDYYDNYLEKVCEDDKELYEKLINYLTAESQYVRVSSKMSVREIAERYHSSHNVSSNLPLCIEYTARYNGVTKKGIYRKGSHSSISNLEDAFLHEIGDMFSIKIDKLNRHESIKEVELVGNIGYDFILDLDNVEDCYKKIGDVVNSQHFKNWRFKGKRDEEEIRLLNFLFQSKHEVLSHKDEGSLIHSYININTCRYAACLESIIMSYNLCEIMTLEEKNKLYNDLYPIFLNEIVPDNKEFFSKLANYLTFENEYYGINGYNTFSNPCRAEVARKVKLHTKVYELCHKVIGRKPSSVDYHLCLDPKLRCNNSKIKYHFKGGAGISNQDHFKATGLEKLLDVISDEEFIFWPFKGLKTDIERLHVLEYEDVFNDINFSEDSYVILCQMVNAIYDKELPKDRLYIKDTLYSELIGYIPLNERETFDILLKYFTYEDHNGFMMSSEYCDLHIKYYCKDTGAYVSSDVLWNTNYFNGLEESRIIAQFSKPFGPCSQKKYHMMDGSYKQEDDYDILNKYYWTFTPSSKLVPPVVRGCNSHQLVAILKSIIDENTKF